MRRPTAHPPRRHAAVPAQARGDVRIGWRHGTQDANDLLEIAVSDSDGMRRLRLTGELDLAGVGRFERLLVADGPPEAGTFVVDMRGLTFIDSSGLRALIIADKRVRAEGGRFVVVRGSEQVNEVLEMTGVAKQIELLDEPPALGGVHPGAGAGGWRSTSSQTVVQPLSRSTPQRSASRSVRKRPQPPGPRSATGSGRLAPKPSPGSLTSTRSRRSEASTRSRIASCGRSRA